MKWRVNVLALIGVIIGIIAIFSTWYSVHDGELLPPNQPERDYNLIDAATLEHPSFGGMLDWQIWIIGAWLFIIGTFIAIFSPLGGILQMIGLWLGPMLGVVITQGVYSSAWPQLLALASAIICCIAIVKPFGLNYGKGPIGLKVRLLTFSKAPEPLPSPDEIPQSPLSKESTPQKSSISKDDGLKIVLHCSQCGKPTDGGAFCKHCGAKLG